MLQSTSSHPILTKISNIISARLHLSPSKHNNLQWFFNYVFHPPALACLLIGVFGILAIEIQLLAMDPLVDKYSAQAASTATDFTNTIATSINNSMYNQSSAYALAVNTQVDGMQTTINDGLFGWVNDTTSTLNDTIVEFYDEVQGAVSKVFNGTILEQAAQEFIRCLIGTKVDAIENALTFLHDNLVVDIPRMNDTALLLSQDQVNEASTPIAAAAIGGGDGDDGGIVGKLVLSYANALKKERITFAVFLALWGLVVFMAVCIILWHSYGKAWMEHRGRRRWQREQRGGDGGLVDPFPLGQPVAGYPREYLDSDVPPSPRRGFTLPSFPRPRFFDSSASDTKANRSWDSFFGEKPSLEPRQRTISEPRRLMAMGRKGREQFVPDHTESDLDGGEHEQNEKRSTAWFGRVANLLSRKQDDPTSETASATSGSSRERLRPNLRISVGRASSARPTFAPPTAGDAPAVDSTDRSHWSSSPVQPPLAPWAKKVLSPKWTTPNVPSKSKPAATRDVPTDVRDSVYQESMPVPSFAPPLHHGFDNRGPPGLQPLRFSSSSAWLKVDPHAPRKDAVNPFVTPFDDEHRVSIQQADPRRSMTTNPFAAVAV